MGSELVRGALYWRVAGACLAETRRSTRRNGARLELPGAETGTSGWIGFVGGIQCGRRRWIGVDGHGCGHSQR